MHPSQLDQQLYVVGDILINRVAPGLTPSSGDLQVGHR
jgi:hypothetical protein